MRRLLAVSLFSLFLIAPAASAPAQTSSKSVVGVDAAGPDAPVAAGSASEASITLRIKPGYHINAQKPTEDYLIGTSLTMTPPAGVTVTKIAYPSAKFAKFSFSETPLAVYDGTAVIKLTMKVDASAAAGQLTVPGKVTFQACNDQQCLPPSNVDVTVPIEVTAAAAAGEAGAAQALTLTGAPPNARILIDGREVGRANAQGRYVSREVKPGRHRVRVEQDGFEAWEQTVNTTADAPQTVTVALVSSEPAAAPPAPETAPASVPPPPSPAPAPASAEPPPSGSNAPLYVGGALVLLVLAGLGAYAATRRNSRG